MEISYMANMVYFWVVLFQLANNVKSTLMLELPILIKKHQMGKVNYDMLHCLLPTSVAFYILGLDQT